MVATRIVVAAAALSLAPFAAAAQAPVWHSLSVDAASAWQRDARVSLEPASFGRASLTMFAAQAGDHDLLFASGARVYPAFLSSTDPRHPFSAYAGAMVAFHRSHAAVRGPCPGNASCILEPTELVTRYGVEPVGEAGFRLLPFVHAMVDVGISARREAFDDPFVHFRCGDWEIRPAVSLGVTW